MRITWNSGVQIERKNIKVIFDSKRRGVDGLAFFVTHGHSDHSAAFRIRKAKKYSSRETLDLISNFGFKVENCTPIRPRERIKIDDIDVIPHNSGHVLGSFEYEVEAPEGTVLFTGDFNTETTKTMRPAEPIQCDVLILEATFGSPSFVFPSIEEISREMVGWAEKIIRTGRIPAFLTDPLGNAQEIIGIFNDHEVPVVTHQSVTRIRHTENFT